MEKVKMYYLRADAKTPGGEHHYLQHVSFCGTRAHFGLDTTQSYSFTPEQRQDFQEKYPYIKGRWVCLRAELKRIRAAKVTPAPPGEQK